jgi:hypothetical protein
MTDFMNDYSNAVAIEGDCPVGFVDLRVYVAPPLEEGESRTPRLRRQIRNSPDEARPR